MNVMKRKSNPIGKKDYKPIIYIYNDQPDQMTFVLIWDLFSKPPTCFT